MNNIGCLVEFKTFASSTSWWTGVWGTNTDEFKLRFNYKGLSIKPTGDAVISGNLDVGPSQSVTSIKACVNHAGHQGSVEIEARWNSPGFIHFNTTNPDGLLLIATKDDLYLYCGLNIICFYTPTANASDDRLKENEELIENACETLPELRPQLYDKKPDMENNDPTTWYTESGLIAQEILRCT